jgi:hypothetical protein
MPITIAADPKRVRMNTFPRISVGGRVTHGGRPVPGRRVRIKGKWTGLKGVTSGPDGSWGATLATPPNRQNYRGWVRATVVGIGTAETIVSRIR